MESFSREESNKIEIPEEDRSLSAKDLMEKYDIGKTTAYEIKHGQKTLGREVAVPMKDKLIKRLEQLGIWQEIDGIPVVNLEKLRRLAFSKYYTKGVEKLGEMSRSELFENLRGEKVVNYADLKELDEDDNDISDLSRPLFYLPPTIKDALDPDYVQAHYPDFQLGLWDVGGNHKWDYQIVLPDGNSISLAELFLTEKIFGELAAERDNSGRLTIIQDGERIPFSAYAFTRKYGQIGGTSGTFEESPWRFLRDHCPRLIEKGLFRPEDFRVMKDIAGTEVSKEKTVAKNGVAYINGAKYILGREFAGWKTTMLEKGMAMLFNEDGTEEYIVLLADEEDIARKMIEMKNDRSRVSFSLKKGEQILPTSICLPGETPKECEERKFAIASRKKVKDLSLELSVRTGIGIHDKLNMREQIWLGNTIEKDSEMKEKIVQGAEKYGVNFLKTFLTNAVGADATESITYLAEKVPSALGSVIFAKTAEIIRASDEFSDYVAITFGQEITPEQKDELVSLMLSRCKALLDNTVKKLEGVKEGEIMHTCHEAIEELRGIKKDVVLFATVCKEAKKSGDLPINELISSHVETKLGSELNNAERAQMRDIFDRTRGRYDNETKDVLLREFDEVLRDEKQRFHLLKVGDKVVAFVRFMTLENGHTYVGSFSTDPSVQGYSLGTALFDTILDQEARRAPVEAIVAVDSPMLAHYTLKNKFVTTGRTLRGKQEYFTLLREDQASVEQEELKAA
ncbi:MAG: GNAT family N-acetyltransferase [Candidatus Paceibacterota bacterium]|jgi:hypothetical protein